MHKVDIDLAVGPQVVDVFLGRALRLVAGAAVVARLFEQAGNLGPVVIEQRRHTRLVRMGRCKFPDDVAEFIGVLREHDLPIPWVDLFTARLVLQFFHLELDRAPDALLLRRELIGSAFQRCQRASRGYRRRLFGAGNHQILPHPFAGMLDKTGDRLLIERVANLHDRHLLGRLRRPDIADQRAASLGFKGSMAGTPGGSK